MLGVSNTDSGLSVNRPALITASVLVAVKLYGLIGMRFWGADLPLLIRWLVYLDVVPFRLAEHTASLFYGDRRIFPTQGEALVFDASLLVYTAVEWYGIVLAWLWLRNKFR